MTTPTKTRVQKHRAKLTAKGWARLEVTIGGSVINRARALARQERCRMWQVVARALKAYFVTGHAAVVPGSSQAAPFAEKQSAAESARAGVPLKESSIASLRPDRDHAMTPKQGALGQATVTGNNQPDAFHALNPRQQRFILEYLLDLNATQAAIRAGYSERSARKIGYQLLDRTRPILTPLLKAQEKRLAKESGITKERWLKAVQHLAFFDIRTLLDETGKPRDISTLTLEDAAAISGFEIVELFAGEGDDRKSIGYTKKFKLFDKLKALELFGKATGYYVEKMEVEQKGPLASLATAVLLKMQAELGSKVAALTLPQGKP